MRRCGCEGGYCTDPGCDYTDEERPRATATDGLTASTKREASGYVGVIKRGREIVWRCPHHHANRDIDTDRNTAARQCASLVLAALTNSSGAQHMIDVMCRGVPHFQNEWQAKHWAWSIDRRRWALGVAESIRAEVVK